MILRQNGLLSDCEQLFTPMSSDEEGHLRGGFGSISGASTIKKINGICENEGCHNDDCENIVCVNDPCANECSNNICGNYDDDITTPHPNNTVLIPCGFL